jgi:ketosteroid isomerase-like protein
VLAPEEVVRQLWDAINARDYARLAGAIAERCDWVSMASGHSYVGPQAMIDGLRAFHDAFPDGRGEIVELHATGDAIVVEWRMSGTNTGGAEPTAQRFSRRGCSVAVVRGGKIAAYRDYFDRQTLTEQLSPAPAASAPTAPAAGPPRRRARRG